MSKTIVITGGSRASAAPRGSVRAARVVRGDPVSRQPAGRRRDGGPRRAGRRPAAGGAGRCVERGGCDGAVRGGAGPLRRAARRGQQRRHRGARAGRGRHERTAAARDIRDQCAGRVPGGARSGAAAVDRARRRGRCAGECVFSGGAARLAARICRLRRLQGRGGHHDAGPGARTGPRGCARQRGAPRPDRHRDPRLRRPAGSCPAPGCRHADGPARHRRGGGRDHRLAAVGCGVVRDGALLDCSGGR